MRRKIVTIMKNKLFTLLFALLTSTTLFAIGRNDGSTQANAIDFDWDNGLVHNTGTKWYCLDLEPLYYGVDSLRFIITNPFDTESVDITCQTSIGGETNTVSQTIAPLSSYKVLELDPKLLVRLKLREIFFIVSSTGNVQLYWQRIVPSGDSCEEAKYPNCQDAETKWYAISAPAIDDRANVDSLVIDFNNWDGDGANIISVSFKTDCNAPAFNSQTFTVPLYDTKTIAFSAELLASLGWPELLFSCTSSTNCCISYSYYMTIPGESCEAPKDLVWNTVNHEAGTDQWYLLHTYGQIPENFDLRFHFTNTSTEVNSIAADILFDCLDPVLVSKNYQLASDEDCYIDIDRDFLDRLGWPSILLHYASNQDSRIWEELIPELPRETFYDTIVSYVDYGEIYLDTIVYQEIVILHDTTWNDTIEFRNGVYLMDSVVTFVIHLNEQGGETPCTIASGTCGDNLTWKYSCDSVLTISGTGAMTDYTYGYSQQVSYTPWKDYLSDIKSIVIADGVTSIGNWAFDDCSSCTSIDIPNSVTRIGSRAFSSSGLTSLYIPSSVTNIGNEAFVDCINLTFIEVATDNSYFSSRDGVLFNNDLTTLIYYPAGKQEGTYVIPNSVISIGNSAFSNCLNLTSIKIPNSVTNIGEYAFFYCSGLISVEMGNSVSSIGRYAFYQCSALTSITISNSVTSIGSQAFFGCRSLTSIINKATTPQSIVASVFNSVNNSSCILYVPAESVAAYQAADVWKEFSSILPISEEDEPQYVTIADTYNMAHDSTFILGAFDVIYVNGAYCYIKDATGYAMIYKNNYGLQAGDHVAAGMEGKINIYYGCYEITPLTTVADLTVTAGEVAAPMEATDAPSADNVNRYVVYQNVSFATDTAFVEGSRNTVRGAWNNQTIRFYNQFRIGATLQAGKTYNITAFNGINNTIIRVYPVAVEEVSGGTPTPCLTDSGTCGENLTWELSCDSVLTISGTGAMTNYSYNTTPWYAYRNTIKTAIFSNGVTSIGSYAFYRCDNLSFVDIPSSLVSISNRAFYDCRSLATIVVDSDNQILDSRDNCNAIIETATNTLILGCKNTLIPNSVTSIGSDAFFYCSGLTSIDIPNSVTSIGYEAFNYCTGLTSVTIPNSVTSIGSYAFDGCSSLTSITIPNSVTNIGSWAFMYCRSITSVIIPSSVTNIGQCAFGGCSSLTSIEVDTNNQNYCSVNGVLFNIDTTIIVQFPAGKEDQSYSIPSTVKTIYDRAFVGCSNLTDLTIPNSVTSIGQCAFGSCGITSIVIPNTVTSIGSSAFWSCPNLSSITCEAVTPPACGFDAFEYVEKSIPLYVPIGSGEAYAAADQWSDFTNIQAVLEIPVYATIADTYNMAQDSAFTLGAFDVVYVASFQNGANIYIKDESGYGVIYKPGYGLQAGDHVEAGLVGKANIYHGLYEVIPVSAKENLTITSGETPAPMEATEAPTLNNVNQYVVYKNVTFDVDTAFVEGLRHLVIGLWNNQEIYFYNQYYIGATLQANKAYNIIAVNTVYGTVPQAYPVAVEEVSGEEPCTTLSGTCGENLTWELTCDSVLTISGSGAMTDFANRAAPWYENRLAIRTLQIGNEVTTIGTYAFTGCSELTSITLGDNITSVGQRAFRDCSNIRTVTIGKNVVALGNGVFNNCNRIEAVQWNAINFRQQKPNQDENSFPFYASRNTITSFIFGEEVEYIPAYLMKDYAAIQQITIPASVTEIGDYAFANDSFVTYMHSPIQAITCYAVTPPTVYAATFMGIDKSACTLYVPYASIGLYRNAYQWSEFFTILPIEEEPVEPDPTYINVNYIDQTGSLFAAEYVALHLPVAPIIEGFSFLKWQVVAGDLEDGIVIQAVYSANEPSSAPEVYTNPANPAQKLIRNGHVYILKDDKVYTIHGQKVK